MQRIAPCQRIYPMSVTVAWMSWGEDFQSARKPTKAEKYDIWMGNQW